MPGRQEFSQGYTELLGFIARNVHKDPLTHTKRGRRLSEVKIPTGREVIVALGPEGGIQTTIYTSHKGRKIRQQITEVAHIVDPAKFDIDNPPKYVQLGVDGTVWDSKSNRPLKEDEIVAYVNEISQ